MNNAKLLGREPAAGPWPIPAPVLRDYLAALDRGVASPCERCAHVLADHRMRCATCGEVRCEKGHNALRLMCSTCSCGWA